MSKAGFIAQLQPYNYSNYPELNGIDTNTPERRLESMVIEGTKPKFINYGR